MSRMKALVAGVAFAAGLTAAAAHAQVGVPWQRTPAVTVIGPEGDPRHAVVDEAVAFWNKTLEELGSGFRLGAVTRLARPVPEDDLRSLGESVLAAQRGTLRVPRVFHELPGDLVIMLADTDFISFAGPFFANSKRVVGIKGMAYWPLTLPNVPRNLITHELGHAIGLGHNSDATTLMCGRPWPCRPNAFRSAEPRMFPLTDEEKQQLLSMYPAAWKPRSP